MQHLLAEHAPVDEYSAKRSAETFLGAISIDHGPPELLGRFFLEAEQAVRRRGITLEWGSFEDLVATNRLNFASWGQLVRVFDCTKGPISKDKAFCILGRNTNGEVVATQAARIYDTDANSLRHVMETLDLFYPEGRPQTASDERCVVTAPSAEVIAGRVTYSGAGWYRRDHRGLALSALLPRLSRAYAHARWNSQYTISMVAKPLLEKGVVKRYGYTKSEWGITSSQNGQVYYEGALVWMDTEELLADLSRFSLGGFPEVDRVVELRNA